VFLQILLAAALVTAAAASVHAHEEPAEGAGWTVALRGEGRR